MFVWLVSYLSFLVNHFSFPQHVAPKAWSLIHISHYWFLMTGDVLGQAGREHYSLDALCKAHFPIYFSEWVNDDLAQPLNVYMSINCLYTVARWLRLKCSFLEWIRGEWTLSNSLCRLAGNVLGLSCNSTERTIEKRAGTMTQLCLTTVCTGIGSLEIRCLVSGFVCHCADLKGFSMNSPT